MLLQIAGTFAFVFSTMIALHYTGALQRRIRTVFRRIAGHKGACVILSGILPVLLRLLLLPVQPPPEPALHDEFSYLLAGDTFASGRMTNPSHPMWIHFETFHEQFVPTYASKYPPAQGLFLALGQKFFGHPWAGVLLSIGLMCASLCWMLQGWLPPAWALLGTLIGTVNIGVSHYFVDSYWGGAAAAIGGSLVLGGYPRMKKRKSVLIALLLAVGILLLANSRPYEGLVLCIPVLTALLISSFKTRSVSRLIPAVPVVLAGLGLMALYNYRVTGSPVVFPYEVNEKLYAVAPAFLMLPLRPVPHYNHEVFRIFWAKMDVEFYHWMRSDVWNASRLKFLVLWRTFIGEWPMAIPLALAPLLVCSRRAKFPLFVLTFFICGLLLQKGTLPHYAAPITGLVCMIMALGLHRMYLWKPDGQPTGKIFANVILVSFVFFFVSKAINISSFEFTPGTKFKVARREMMSRLGEMPGNHLVLIRYTPDHDVHDEWVHNRADIDASKIVWARDMGMEQNRRLLQYYSNRRVWVLEPDLPEAKLVAQK